KNRREDSQDDFYCPDYPLFHAVFNTLYQNREGSSKEEIEEARTTLADLVNGKWLMTLSRVKYKPNGDDLVVHNHGLGDSYEVQIPFVGPDGWIKESGTNSQQALQALLSTQQSPGEINDVYKWFREKDGHIWRVNSTPGSTNERVARFNAYSDRSNFDCDRNPQFSDSSVGVRARKIG
ncbi:hypothetical protein K8R33_04455, partial [archaeon]|nr:hypothetical protein [archaeon]